MCILVKAPDRYMYELWRFHALLFLLVTVTGRSTVHWPKKQGAVPPSPPILIRKVGIVPSKPIALL